MYWRTNAGRDEFHFVDKWGPEYEADLAIEFIQNESDKFRDPEKPFALVVSMNPPHLPYHLVPEKYKEVYNAKEPEIEKFCKNSINTEHDLFWQDYLRQHLRDQYAMITGIDEHFGRILESVKTSGAEDSTIVVFLSDHGDCIGIHGKKSKDNPYEESLRIPLMIKFPGTIPPRHDGMLISFPDLYPTILSLLGFKTSIPDQVEGRDFSEYCRTGQGVRPESQYYFSLGFFSEKSKRPIPGKINAGERGIRTEKYTLVCDKEPDGNIEWFLWDRQTDPSQVNNLAEENPELKNMLYNKYLLPWLKELNDPWLEVDE
jgi:arylsulfatase A-like enzyme